MGILYCVCLVVFGSFFLLNLVLAVIMQSFLNVQTAEEQINEADQPSPDSEITDNAIAEEENDDVSPIIGLKTLDKKKLTAFPEFGQYELEN